MNENYLFIGGGFFGDANTTFGEEVTGGTEKQREREQYCFACAYCILCLNYGTMF
jgi:hypothetical protein